ncbi:MAG: RNA-binding S4 domain-containing protein, partial [Bacteroidales bacterium]|nr:RNA-binding S4 domain-containing protein [Bacteroidales bacterium]
MPKIEENLRIDKWLWAVRLYKTRSLASTACKNNQISIEGVYVKPSHIVKIGDVVCVKRPPIVRSYEVLGLLAQRESAKVVVDFVKDVTPQSDLQTLEDGTMVFTVSRAKGA